MKTFANILIALVVVGAVSAVPFANNTNNNSAQTNETSSVRLAKPNEAPYAVFLFHSTRGLFCGGVIIHPNWVLTAANCLSNTTFSVVAGVHDLNDIKNLDNVDHLNNSDIQIRTIPDASHYIIHTLYDDEVGNIDIAMVYTRKAFNFRSSPRVKLIQLPTEEYPEEGVGKLFGWSFASRSLDHMHLMAMDTVVVGFEKCRDAMNYDEKLMPYNICTSGEYGPCGQDSGAPLIRSTPGGDVLVGLATWPKKDCYPMTEPSMYTNVLVFTDWIRKNIFDYMMINP